MRSKLELGIRKAMLVEATGHPSDHHPYLLAEPVMSEGQISSASASTEHLPSNYSQELHGIGNVFTHPPPPLPGSQKRRRPSKFGMPSIIKRSASTPNIRGQAAADAAALAEKRRNKLGYHRTSVACGEHCPLGALLSSASNTVLLRPLPKTQDKMFASYR